MGQDNLELHRRYITISYVFMFLTLLTLVFGIAAYWFARKVVQVEQTEVWLQAHALWIMRNIVLFLILAAFSALWFIPLIFFYWDSQLWVTACMVAGVVFSGIAWLYLLNAWIKGLSRYIKHKAVF